MRLFLSLCRDAARRRERGPMGRVRVAFLDLLYLAAPLVARFFGRSSFLEITCSPRSAVEEARTAAAAAPAPAAGRPRVA